MNGDGQNSIPEATVLGGKLKAGLAFLAGTGAATPKADIDLIHQRLKAAKQMAKELSR